MFQHLNKILLQFLKCFKREATWKNFVVVIICLMIRANNRTITSMVSCLRLDPKQYYNLLHFYRSNGYAISDLYDKWIEVAQNEAPLKRISERIILVGDHIKISKEARRMPDIQTLHQDSENSGKGEFIEGHNFAQICAIIENDNVSRALPLITELQKSPPRKEETKEPDGETLVTQMVNLVGKAVKSLNDNDKAIVALDAYFSKASAFLAADKVVDELGNRRLEIVTRARDDSVAFTHPEPRPKGKRGRNKKHEKVKLMSLFSDKSDFTKTTLLLYGKTTKVNYKCLDLMWEPLEMRVVRFVLIETARGRAILMSSDLTLSAEEIITIYCLRFKIETCFDEQKNDMGVFSYHFWTTALEKRKRWSKNAITLEVEYPERVDRAKRAIESFVCMGTIASGISTIIAFSHSSLIWKWYPGWIKTIRSTVPSMAIVKESFAQAFPTFSRTHSDLRICSVFNSRLRKDIFLYDDVA